MDKLRSRIESRKGFTLIELIIVVIIVGVLAALALPQYTGFVEKARAAEAIAVLGSFKIAEEATRIEGGNYTTTITNLPVNYSTTNWTYDIAAANATSFTARANRTKSGTHNGFLVNMTYNSAGTSSWSGNHPGAPK